MDSVINNYFSFVTDENEMGDGMMERVWITFWYRYSDHDDLDSRRDREDEGQCPSSSGKSL